MPIVGKRYKHKYYTNFTIIISNSINNEFFFTDYGWKIHISDFWNWFEELPEDNKTPNPVDLEKGEVNEVEKALEELKEEIKTTEKTIERVCKVGNWTPNLLIMKAQKLVDALGAEKNMSKEEPKIDMKEERVKPVSIWKDVNEKIDNQSIIFVNKAGYARLGEYWNDAIYFIEGDSGDVIVHLIDKNYYGKKYCTLTDFVNSFEQMQKDIQELKRK
jgi:hypothetical protein